MHPQIVAVPVGRNAGVKHRRDLRGAIFGGDLGEAAELLAGARLQAAREQWRVGAQLVADQRLGEQRGYALVGDVGDRDVLLVGEADLAGSVRARERVHLAELVGGDASDRHAQSDGGAGAVVLGGDADVIVAVQRRRVRSAVTERPSDAAFDLGAEGVRADAVEQELEACFAARGAVRVAVAEDRGDVFDGLDRLLRGEEHVDPPREPRC
jgi:hypothetical protein